MPVQPTLSADDATEIAAACVDEGGSQTTDGVLAAFNTLNLTAQQLAILQLLAANVKAHG